MADPLSITSGVLSLLGSTWKVAVELKKFHDEVSVVNKTVADLEQDVEGLGRVLESMRDTFANITAENGSGTGHVASHWSNLARSIEDGKSMLQRLSEQILEINKSKSFMDGPRKQLRLNMAQERLSNFRTHIQSYREGLQLSLQTIILWNQVSYQKSADQVLPNLSDLHKDVRRIALDLNQKIEALQSLVQSPQDEAEVIAMHNLRECVRSAASIVSSASTMVASQQGDARASVIPASDFGDCFPVAQNLAVRRWMESKTIYEYSEASSRVPPQSVADVPGFSDSEEGSNSDSDLETEITSMLLENGKRKLAAGDLKAAERMLKNCMTRMAAMRTDKRHSTGHTSRHLEVATHLFDLYRNQNRLEDAQKMLRQRMSIRERAFGKKDAVFLQDVLLLATLLKTKGDLLEAQLHARRALKGFKRTDEVPRVRECLVLLVEVCNQNEDDREAYALMLSRIDGDSASNPAAPVDGFAADGSFGLTVSSTSLDTQNTASDFQKSSVLGPENIKDERNNALREPQQGASELQHSTSEYEDHPPSPTRRNASELAPVSPVIQEITALGKGGSQTVQRRIEQEPKDAAAEFQSSGLHPRNVSTVVPIPKAPKDDRRDTPTLLLPSATSRDTLRMSQSERGAVVDDAVTDDSSGDADFVDARTHTEIQKSVSLPDIRVDSRAVGREEHDSTALPARPRSTSTNAERGLRSDTESHINPTVFQLRIGGDVAFRRISNLPWDRAFCYIINRTYTLRCKPNRNADSLSCTILISDLRGASVRPRKEEDGFGIEISLPDLVDVVFLKLRDLWELDLWLEALREQSRRPRVRSYLPAEGSISRQSDQPGMIAVDGFVNRVSLDWAQNFDIYTGDKKIKMALRFLLQMGFTTVEIGAHADYIKRFIEKHAAEATADEVANSAAIASCFLRENTTTIEGASVSAFGLAQASFNPAASTDVRSGQIGTAGLFKEVEQSSGGLSYDSIEPYGENERPANLLPAHRLDAANLAKVPGGPFRNPDNSTLDLMNASSVSMTEESAVKSPSAPSKYLGQLAKGAGSSTDPRRKIVFVGPACAGKSALLIRRCQSTFSEDFLPPTLFESYITEVYVEGRTVELVLWDTAGLESYDRLRALSYGDAHCVVICFSIGDPISLEELDLKFIPEVQRACKGVPKLLVGCQMDLRDNAEHILKLKETENAAPVDQITALALRQKIGAREYFECSAKTGEGVDNVFEQAASIAFKKGELGHRKKRSRLKNLFISDD